MGQKSYRIDLIDRSKRKYSLGSVAQQNVKCSSKHGGQVCVYGALKSAPKDQQAYLKVASSHGDVIKISISNGQKTYLGDFCISFFDPQSQQAVFRSVGNISISS